MADQDKQARGITAIEVKGFKSLRDETRIAIRPLTVLAGANSSGKSSIMQPLLLLKQTLESSPYDRGALKLDGPNVQYTEASQFFSFKTGADESDAHFMLKVTWGGDVSVKNVYQLTSERPRLKLVSTSVYGLDGEETLIHDMPQEEVVRFAEKAFGRRLQNPDLNLSITRFNGFLALVSSSERRLGLLSIFLVPEELTESISQIIHIPGIRTFPSRTYPLVLVTNNRFQGTFENFVAQVLVSWQDAVDPKLDVLFSQLRILSLTSRVIALLLNETEVELHVGRTAESEHNDTVNITDVGLGVSQVLPVLVALLVAEPGQLVYIEQPELHLHPRAQVTLAQILADAANRGVRVVIETHSDLVLLGIQTLVAEKTLSPNDVILHWFERDKEGCTKVTSTDLDEFGRMEMSDFPEDFGTVRFEAQGRFLDAVDITEADMESGD